MIFHFLGTQFYILAFIIIQTHGYVLVAANLDDFKTVAKRLVPEKLANQLADLASHPSVKYMREREQSREATESESSLSDDDENRRGVSNPKEKTKEVHLAKINFEDLVQKVRERIEKDLEKSQKKIEVVPEDIAAPQSYNQERPIQVSRFANVRTTKGSKQTNLVKQFEQPLYEHLQAQEDGMTFAKIEMKRKDSYEDYVTPEKEKNIFEDEVDRFETTTLRQIPDYINHETDRPIDYAYDDKTEEYKENTEELKAKTEDLWYDYKQANDTDEYTNTTPMKRKVTKNVKATMIPKRDFYKMSSPNYFAKVPIVAEKYDFDEPIPEKDREPENLKPIKGLYPAIINGKIKQNE